MAQRFEYNSPEMSKAQAEANEYLKSKNIFELFNFLVGHLLVHEPDDPVEFLITLLNKCLMFREGMAQPPLLFNKHHIESIFKAMDPGAIGTVSMEQYKTGMTTLGVSKYMLNPLRDEEGKVTEHTFVDNAIQSMVIMLSEMLKKN